MNPSSHNAPDPGSGETAKALGRFGRRVAAAISSANDKLFIPDAMLAHFLDELGAGSFDPKSTGGDLMALALQAQALAPRACDLLVLQLLALCGVMERTPASQSRSLTAARDSQAFLGRTAPRWTTSTDTDRASGGILDFLLRQAVPPKKKDQAKP